MAETAEILLERIDRRLGEMGKSRYWLAKEATEGKNTGLVTDLARKGYVPKEPRLKRIAELLGVSIDWLMGRTNNSAPVQSEVALADRHFEWHGHPPGEPGLPLVGTGDCADLELSDESGHLVAVERNSFDPDYTVRILARPPALRGAVDAYAIEFRGDSMWPRFEPGEIGIVEPRRPVSRGDYVLLQLTSGEDDEVISVLVKRLVRETQREFVLQQFNPPLTFTVAKSRVAGQRAQLVRRQSEYLF